MPWCMRFYLMVFLVNVVVYVSDMMSARMALSLPLCTFTAYFHYVSLPILQHFDLLFQDPTKRPTNEEILKHAVFSAGLTE